MTEPSRRRYAPLLDVHPAKDPDTAYADARAGLVPGAFRLKPGGRWYVDLDVWEAHVARLLRRCDCGYLPTRSGESRCPSCDERLPEANVPEDQD